MSDEVWLMMLFVWFGFLAWLWWRMSRLIRKIEDTLDRINDTLDRINETLLFLDSVVLPNMERKLIEVQTKKEASK